MTSQSKCKQPPWKVIIERCETKMEEKFKEYGNTWLTTSTTLDSEFWKQRLQEELDEIKNRIGGLGHYETAMECVDLINICAMIYTQEMGNHIEYLRMGRHGD